VAEFVQGRSARNVLQLGVFEDSQRHFALKLYQAVQAKPIDREKKIKISKLEKVTGRGGWRADKIGSPGVGELRWERQASSPNPFAFLAHPVLRRRARTGQDRRQGCGEAHPGIPVPHGEEDFRGDVGVVDDVLIKDAIR
jgi:hypothetical protein